MVRRTAKRGTSAGNVFWGCTGYPACCGARPIN
jgi:restriction system protein